MKVAIINSVYGAGSTGKIVKELQDTLNENGVECRVFYGRKSQDQINGGYFFGSDFSVKSHALASRVFGKQGLRSNRATKQLVTMLNEFKPEIINLHNIHGYYLNYKILFEYIISNNVKVFWTLHDLWPITGHCAYFEDCDYINECKKCKFKSSYPKAIFDNTHKNYLIKKQLFSKADITFICPSEWIKTQMQKSFLKDKPCIVINNGINLKNYNRVNSDFRFRYGLKDKKVILGVALVWDKRKGLETFNKLAEDLPESYQIVLVGLGGEIVNSKIYALPKVSLSNLVEIYSSCDIFVNPTMMDNLPTVNIEALSCGLPVITYNTGGSAEIIDESCGICVQKGNYEQLIDSILSFDFKNKTIQNCQNRAKLFDKKDKYLEYLKVFKG